MYRVIFFLSISGLVLSGWALVGIVLSLIYLAWFHNGYEIVLLAILVDAYYGAFSFVPWATIATFFVWSISLYLKERLLLYTENA